MNAIAGGLLTRTYKEYYKGDQLSDSPDRSRLFMAQNIANRLLASDLVSSPKTTVLNLGAGRHSVEMLLRMLAYSAADNGKYGKLTDKLHKSQVITLDIAAGASRRQPNWVHHVIADNAALPIGNESVDLVVSNHSVDMLRMEEGAFESALEDVRRVLSPAGSIFFQYHHAQLFDRQCAYYQKQYPNSPQAQIYDPSLTNPFYGDRQSIIDDLAIAGLSATAVYLETDNYDDWWCVEAQKNVTT